MKVKIFTLLSSVLVSGLLYAQDIQVTNKWQLLGALEDISSSSFDGKCVDFVWKYDNGWQVHIANGNSYNLPSNITQFDTIHKGQGFWIKGNGKCDVNASNDNSFKFTKDMLAGKTFYTVDEDDNGNLQVTKLIFNNSLSSIDAISPNSTENWGININGNKLTFSDDTDNSYTIIKPMNDYILFEDYNGNGSIDGQGHRLYVNKADAEAYLNSLMADYKEITISGKVNFQDSKGNIKPIPNNVKIHIRPSENNWNPSIVINIDNNGYFNKTISVKKEYFKTNDSFPFVVFGDTNDNNNWDGDSGTVNNTGTLENDIRYLDTSKTLSDLQNIDVIIN